MSRIRWYHPVFVLALFDAVVILLSLEMHRETFSSVDRLIESAASLDERNRCLKRLEQCVLELNAAGNSVFASRKPQEERGRFVQARTALDRAFKSAAAYKLNTNLVRARVDALSSAAGEVFSDFEKLQLAPTAEEAQSLWAHASTAMSRMDLEQLGAMRAIGVLAEQSRSDQRNVWDEHEANLQARVLYERYFIAAVVCMLFGLLWFGYRLQKADQALAAERRAVQEERRERLAAIGELCSSVAHGIRNPLAAMQLSAQLALELGKMDEESKSRLHDILSEGARLGDRVTGLLNAARMQADAFESVRLQEIVASAVQGIRSELARQGLALEEEWPSEPIAVRGDRRQLEQLVVELVSNAMEHSPAGAAIHVACERPHSNGIACIRVDDAGPGVPEAIRDRVFDMFFTTKPTGTGIGLATVKRIARLHGGDVALSRSPSGGARFEVTLPAADGTA